MLSGEFRHSVDPKNRLFIPAKHRDELMQGSDCFVLARSMRGKCLKIYSMSGWEEYIAPILKLERRQSEAILRTLHRDAAQVTADSQGRIVIPQSLIAHAGIVKGAVVVGCGSYGEIWAEEEYDRMVDSEDLDEIRATLEFYGL